MAEPRLELVDPRRGELPGALVEQPHHRNGILDLALGAREPALHVQIIEPHPVRARIGDGGDLFAILDGCAQRAPGQIQPPRRRRAHRVERRSDDRIRARSRDLFADDDPARRKNDQETNDQARVFHFSTPGCNRAAAMDRDHSASGAVDQMLDLRRFSDGAGGFADIEGVAEHDVALVQRRCRAQAGAVGMAAWVARKAAPTPSKTGMRGDVLRQTSTT